MGEKVTLLTDKEREQGLQELEDKGVFLGEILDVDYLKLRLTRMEARGYTGDATLKLRKQIELLEDALVIYHLKSPERK